MYTMTFLLVAFTVATPAFSDESNGNRAGFYQMGIIDDPLPIQFDGITNVDFYQDFIPAVVYRYRQDHKVNFVCVGTVFPTGTNTYSIIVPEHLFSEDIGFNGAFAVRIARPDNHIIIGFIDKITDSGSNLFGLDIAIATISTNSRVIAPFHFDGGKEAIQTFSSYTVNVRGRETKTLRSLITGKEAKIIGYGVKINAEINRRLRVGEKIIVEEQHPYVLVEFESNKGYSGIAFFDENRRLFIVHGGFATEELEPKTAKGFFNVYGRNPKNVCVLVGPLSIN